MFAQHENIRQQTYALNNPQVKQRMFSEVQKLIASQIDQKLNSELPQVPKLVRKQNTDKFNQVMMKNPKIQTLLGEFLDQLDRILDKEFKMNKI